MKFQTVSHPGTGSEHTRMVYKVAFRSNVHGIYQLKMNLN